MVKLDEASVRLIRSLHKSGVPRRFIAKQFDVHNQTVTDIMAGKTWKHLV